MQFGACKVLLAQKERDKASVALPKICVTPLEGTADEADEWAHHEHILIFFYQSHLIF